MARILDDEDHSIDERRELIVGHSMQDRPLMICFTEREGAVRIISARKATKNERKDYGVARYAAYATGPDVARVPARLPKGAPEQVCLAIQGTDGGQGSTNSR